MQLEFSFSDKEKEFFKVYQELLPKYYNKPAQFKILLELEAAHLGLENWEETLGKIEEFLRIYLFFKSLRSKLEEIFPVKGELLEVLKKYPYFVEYEARFNFPSKTAQYDGFKWYSPLLFAGGSDGRVRVWKYENGAFHLLKELGEEIAEKPLYEFDGENVFYSAGGKLTVYNLESGKKVDEVDIGQPPVAMNRSENAVYIYKRVENIAIKQRVLLEDGKITFGAADIVSPTEIESGELDMAAVEGKLLKVKDGELLLFKGGKKEEKIDFVEDKKIAFNSPVNDLLIYKNYTIVAPSKTKPAVINIETGEILTELNIPAKHSYKVVKNPQRNEFAISHSDNVISIWNLENLQLERVLESYFIDVLALDYSPDGRYLAAAGEGRDINIFDTESWKLVKDIDLPVEGVMAVEFSPDGKYLAAGCGDYNVYLIDTETWEVVKTFKKHEYLISDIVFLEGGKKMISASWDGQAILWDVESGEPVKTLAATDERIWKVSVSPDEKFIALGDWNGKVEILETANWQPVKSWKEKSRVLALAFSEDYLLVGRKDGTIEVIRVERTEQLQEGSIENLGKSPAESVVGVTTFDGNLLAYTESGFLRIWNSVGEKVFSAFVDGELTHTENLREPRIEIKVLPETFILKRDNYFFGGKGWQNRVEIVKGLEFVKDKTDFVREITKPELMKEV
jgi:WD40 repeat protein